MPQMKAFEARWEAMSVEERAAEISERKLYPSLQKMSENFEKKRKSGEMKRNVDLVPHFVNAFKSAREVRSQHKKGSDEANTAHFAMQNVRLSASQQLSHKDFMRFRREVGE